MGNMVGSGVFLLPAALASYGSISLAGWVFTSIGALLLALMFSRLSRTLPADGGPYAYSRAGLGDFAGFWVAWGYWISLIGGNAAISVAMVGYLSVFVPAIGASGFAAAMAALAAIWILTFVNAMGIRSAGNVQIVTTILKLLPLIAITVAAFFHFQPSHFSVVNASDLSTPSAINATATLTLWAFLGLESATVPAENVDDASETIPRATLIGTVVVAVFYIASTVAVMGLVPMDVLAESKAPFADAARLLWGDWGAWMVAVGATISCFGALNGWILLTAKVPMAAARDGLFPAVFGRVSARGMPAMGLVVSGVIVTVLVATNYTRGLVGLFTFAILLSTFTVLIPYAFSAAADLWLIRGEGLGSGRSRFRAIAISSLAFLYSFWAMVGSGEEIVYLGFMMLMAGLPVYVWLLHSADRRQKLDEATQSGSSRPG